MQDLLNSESNDEINLREMFITLWAYKLFIACTCVLGIIFGGYYALNINKVFTSAAIFKLDNGARKSISLGNELNALASFVGIGSSSNPMAIPLDQITGKIFIEKLDKKLNFQAETYFNTYNPNPVDPKWMSVIKRVIGWQKKFPANVEDAMWEGIVKKYSKNIMVDITEEGSIKIMVTHEVPQRAAKIANVIMDTIINIQKKQKDDDQDQMLFYMSNTLANALNDLEVSQSNLKEFAIKNTAMPLESFTAGSLQLDALREQLDRTSELHDAVAALLLMLQNKTTDQNNYLALRKEFPIIDQVEFRRILGQNEIIGSWGWPEINTVDAIFDTLSERKSRLQSQINSSQLDAERSGFALETYARLQREAKIAEATYTVLIEQVKAQSMLAGYRPDKTEIYEYASVPTNSSTPKRDQILVLGAVLGLFVGVALSYLLSLRRGVYYSKESLKAAVHAPLTDSISAIKPLRKKSLDDVNKMLVKKPCSVLRDMAVEIHNSDTAQVVITSLSAQLTGNDLARAIAMYMQSDSIKVAVIDFSSKAKKLDIGARRFSFESFVVAESAGNVSVLTPNNDLTAMELLSQKDFAKNMQSLSSTIDLLLLCADNGDATSLLRALQGQKTFHISLSRTKHTKSADLAHINSLLPIQGLLHD
jgi:uncharacterized protein involved in exopolysaccharide biosynthesis